MSAALVWFRRDLRVQDHAALSHALQSHQRVHCVFVFDTTILDPLPRRDRRVEFILRAVEEVAAIALLLASDDCTWAPAPCMPIATTHRPPLRAMAR